jgi:hypothetical protein
MSTANVVTGAEVNPLVSKTVCLVLRFSRPGITRRLRVDEFEAKDAEKDLVGAQKKIVDCPEYGQVAALDRSIKAFVASKALPSKLYRDGTYLIPIASMEAVDKFLMQAKPERSARVETYVAAYPQAKAETMKRLGKLAHEEDYLTPNQVRDAFDFDYEYVTLSTPSNLKQVSLAMFEREAQRLRERMSSAEEEIRAAFRVKFLQMVQGMKAMLDGTTNEKGRAQRYAHAGRRIEKLTEYIETFKAEGNVSGDAELVKIMTEASKLLQGVDPKELKDDAKWQATLSTYFGGVEQQLASMTKVKTKRLIETDEEPSIDPAQASA